MRGQQQHNKNIMRLLCMCVAWGEKQAAQRGLLRMC